MPTPAQLILVILAAAILVVGGVLSASRLRSQRPWLLPAARICLLLGVVLTLAALLWHAILRGDWLPITDNFDALLWLALLLSLFVLYIQRSGGRHGLGGVDWFVMPVVVLLLAAAAWFGMRDYQRYQPIVQDLWAWVHRVSAYAGAAAFAVAAAGGAVYVVMSRRLRRKIPMHPRLGSLERMERLTTLAVRLGFALLTIALVTGLVKMLAEGERITPAKLGLSCAAWIVYAIVLHAPINPVFRGRRAAVLSILGFLLIMGTVVAVQMSGGGH
jgi:ABC-type uncharacterized transport system permease subunit